MTALIVVDIIKVLYRMFSEIIQIVIFFFQNAFLCMISLFYLHLLWNAAFRERVRVYSNWRFIYIFVLVLYITYMYYNLHKLKKSADVIMVFHILVNFFNFFKSLKSIKTLVHNLWNCGQIWDHRLEMISTLQCAFLFLYIIKLILAFLL